MKQRICMVTQSYYLRDPRVRRQAEALVEAGYEVDVIALKDRGCKWRETVNGVRIYNLPPARKRARRLRYVFEYSVFLVVAATAQALLHLRRRYCLVHVNNMPDLLVFSALIPRLLGAKVLLDVHDPMPELFMSKYGLSEKGWFVRLLRFQEAISNRFAHFTLTVSDVMQDRLVKLGVPAERTGVVLNVPDPKIFHRLRAEDAPGSRPNGGFTLLFTGTVAERHGLDLAMRAVAEARRTCPGLGLRIVGEGDHLPCLKRLREELGASEYVEFHPPVPITDIPSIAQSCDAAIQPQLKDCHTDLYFSTKVVESFAMGLPVIASATETLTRYFQKSQLVFVKPGDVEDLAGAIVRLCKDSELRRSLVAEGFQVFDRLNWDIEKQKFLSIIESVLASRTGTVEEGAHG